MILTITMNPALDKVYAVDDFKINKVYRPRDMTATAGGKGLNVARVINQLKGELMITGLVGGSTGTYIREEIQKLGIEEHFVNITGETRTCINIMDEKNTTSTEILEPGPEITEEELEEFLCSYKEIIKECNIIAASGSLPRGVPDDFYKTLIKIAKEKNKKFILDTSGIYLKEGIIGRPFMIKPNVDEIENLLDKKPGTLNDYCKLLIKLKAQGIQLPVITLGQKGCIAEIDGDFLHYLPSPLEVLNTVGSGDAFVAGCALGLERGLDLIEVIKFGMACGMANTQFFKTGMVTEELVNKFFSEIKIKKL